MTKTLLCDCNRSMPLDRTAIQAALAKTPGVRLSTMLLMRGPFQDGDPDRTAWTLIYTVPEQPALFVLVDAVDGKVRRSWRG